MLGAPRISPSIRTRSTPAPRQDNVGALAQKAGVSGEQLSGMLAAVLPHLVDRATPNGQVPPEGQLDLTDVLGSLGGLAGLFGKSEEPPKQR